MEETKINIIEEMKDVLVSEGVEKNTAVKSLRIFCRHFGGQMLYFPNKTTLNKAADIFFMLKKEMEENEAEKITRIIVKSFGGDYEYIPKEDRMFRHEITKEIYKLYHSENIENRMQKICIKYNITYAQVYKLMNEYKQHFKKNKVAKSKKR